jgi:tetratricopeptide (TPR) repeat protein
MLAEMLNDRDVIRLRSQQLQAVLWLEPTNPLARDLYAKTLLDANQKREAYAEVSRSVNDAPTLDSHTYLQPRILPFLSSEARAAVEAGFAAAVKSHYEGALQNFAQYYDELGAFSAEAALYLRAASEEKNRGQRAAYLIDAGIGYAKAQKLKQAEAAFHAGALAAPQRFVAYQQMMLLVLAPLRNLDAAKLTVARGIEAGADPFPLYLALSSVAQMSGNDREAEASLKKAAAIRPSSTEPLLRIGELDLAMKNFDQAVVWLKKAAKIKPSAEAFYELGLADEGAYEYFAAEKNYQQALALAPTNQSLKASYEQFCQKLAQAKHDSFTP